MMPLYRFGEFTLDTRSGELRRGAYRVRLRPQPATVLEYLLQHPGDVVTRAELRQVLWPEGTFVHFDHGLNSCIKQLRAALLDSRGTPRFLETLPRRGYRFVASVATDWGPDERRSPDLGGSDAGETTEGDYRVSGTALVQRGRVRLRLSLTQTASNTRIWTSDFDCDVDDIRHTQAEIATKLLEGIKEALRAGVSQTVATTGRTNAAMM